MEVIIDEITGCERTEFEKPKYRGKTEHGGEWCFGVPISSSDGVFMMNPENHQTCGSKMNVETLDASTGFVNNSGVELFVNDIVSFNKVDNYRIGYGNFIICTGHGEELEESICTGLFLESFDFEAGCWVRDPFLEHENGYVPVGRMVPIANFEVVGNMTDNPDLMEVKVYAGALEVTEEELVERFKATIGGKK